MLVIVFSGLFVLTMAAGPLVAQDAKEKTQAKKVVRKPPRGRLPAYYGEVVDQKQRQQIYDIQKKYRDDINQLKADLQALLDKQRAEIAAVLSSEQAAKVATLREEALKRRREQLAREKTADVIRAALDAGRYTEVLTLVDQGECLSTSVDTGCPFLASAGTPNGDPDDLASARGSHWARPPLAGLPEN